jgi:hypothetical protein
VYADDSYENLYHLEGCDEYRCVGVEFQFASSAGLVADMCGLFYVRQRICVSNTPASTCMFTFVSLLSQK